MNRRNLLAAAIATLVAPALPRERPHDGPYFIGYDPARGDDQACLTWWRQNPSGTLELTGSTYDYERMCQVWKKCLADGRAQIIRLPDYAFVEAFNG